MSKDKMTQEIYLDMSILDTKLIIVKLFIIELKGQALGTEILSIWIDKDFLPLGPDEALQSFKMETKFDPDELDYYYTSLLLY
jgi:hypothetical protein